MLVTLSAKNRYCVCVKTWFLQGTVQIRNTVNELRCVQNRVAEPYPIGSGFKRVSWSVCGIRIRIQEDKNDPQSSKKFRISYIEVLDVLLRAEGFFCNFLYGGIWIGKLYNLIQLNFFPAELFFYFVVFKTLDPDHIRIRNLGSKIGLKNGFIIFVVTSMTVSIGIWWFS